MFDGSFKSSRKVNLSGRKLTTAGGTGGANASLSKDELLLQSKRLREERLAHKQRSAASTTIQALYRRVATTRRVRSRALTELETELAALVGPGGAPPSAPVATATLQQLVCKFLIASGRKDRVLLAQDVATQRLANAQNYVLVMLLMSAVQGGERGVLAMPKDATWVYQIVRVLEIALRIVVGLIGDTTDQVKAVCLVLLETFTTRERYIAAGAQDADTVLPRVVQQLAQSDGIGVFAALRRLVQRDEAVASEDRVQQIVVRLAVLSLQPLYSECVSTTQSSLERNPVLVQFARKIVLTPGAFSSPLMQRVMQGLSSTTTKSPTQQDGVFWGATLSVLCREEDAGLSWRDAAIAVGNVLDLLALSGFPPSIVERGTALLARVITTSHIQWAYRVESSSPSTITSGQVDVDMDDDDYALATAQSQLVLEAFDHHDDGDQVEKGIQSLGASQQRIQSQWQQLYETRFVQRLFDAAQAPSAMRHLSRVYTTFLLGLGRTHLLSVRQSFKLPPLEFTAFLSAVSRELLDNVTVIKRVWDLVRSSSATRSRSEETLQPLLLFNAIYSHMLLTLDDETFYDRAWPFQLGDIADIVTYLKQFIFDVCWNANTTTSAQQEDANANHNMNRHLFPALTTSVKLFNQLYDRDCRRKFSSDGAWLWPSMPVIKETVDLASMEGDLVELQALASLTSPHATLTPQARASLILTTIPQVFSFPDRVQLFEKLLNEEKQSMDHVRSEFSRALHVRVKRDEIVDDSYEFFHKVCALQSPSALKSRIKVTFVNEQGLEEAGIDGGGVFKEYVDQLTREAFSPEYGFFLATNEQLLYPNPGARWIVETPTDLMDRFRFLGRVLGKAVYEEILVEPQFAAFFLNKLLGKFNYIDDLHSLDPDLYRNLMQLKHYDGSVEDLALTFSVSEKAFGQVVTRDLIPDGANIPVTNESKIRYIHLLANYKLNVLSSHESAAFLRGFRDLIPAKWIQMFSPSELQMLIGGTAQTIDVVDWQRHTAYGGGYHPSQRPIQWFWDLVENEFTAEDRAALLKFITSVSRQPLLGFAQLAPQICIHQVRIDDDERLPSSATCMNLLKLPTYSSKAIMKKKLLYAIRANAGFDLS